MTNKEEEKHYRYKLLVTDSLEELSISIEKYTNESPLWEPVGRIEKCHHWDKPKYTLMLRVRKE